LLVNGVAWKALIEEEFSDGIDFDMTIERQADRRATACASRMTGRFLPFKYYGAKGRVDAGLSGGVGGLASQARWQEPNVIGRRVHADQMRMANF
jgi:hypothetical protein